MPKLTFEIPTDIKDIIKRHEEIDWNKVVNKAIWNYAKKIKLLESITAKSRLTESDVDDLDHEIKAALTKRYQKTVVSSAGSGLQPEPRNLFWQ